MRNIRTAAEARAWLDRQGLSIQQFARDHGVDPATTYQVLSGRKKGRRGEAHKVAVLLGMKDGVIMPEWPDYSGLHSGHSIRQKQPSSPTRAKPARK